MPHIPNTGLVVWLFRQVSIVFVIDYNSYPAMNRTVWSNIQPQTVPILKIHPPVPLLNCLVSFSSFFLTLNSQNSLRVSPIFNFTHFDWSNHYWPVANVFFRILFFGSNHGPNWFRSGFWSNLWNHRARQRGISQLYDLAISDTTHYLIWSGLLFESFLSLVSLFSFWRYEV